MPAQTAFQQALALTLREEGGYSNNPADPGRATLWGITQATYDDWRVEHHATVRNVALMAKVECECIYSAEYWHPIKGDDLPFPLAVCLFDFAVNSGVSGAVKQLQHCLKLKPDGVLGPVTLAAIVKADVSTLIVALSDARLHYDQQLKPFPIFGSGWTARIRRIKEASLSLASVGNTFTTALT
jgi:lysozyme family protein